MQRFSITRTTLLAGAAFAASSSVALSQATFTIMGDGSISDVNPAGTAAVGGNNMGPFLWTQSGGVVQLGQDDARSVSDDGTVVLGNMTDISGDRFAGRWTLATGWVSLGGIGGQSGTSVSSGYDMSGDGTIAVGLGWVNAGTAGAFRWTQAGGMGTLPQLGVNSSRASAMTRDGQWIGGFDEHSTGPRRAAIWDSALTETLILEGSAANPDGYGEVLGFSSNGTYVLGSEFGTGFVWSAAGGAINTGPLPGGCCTDAGWAVGASDDGTKVIGTYRFFPFPLVATIWTPGVGLERLSDYITQRGATIPAGLELSQAIAISPDGNTIWGYATTPTFQNSWFKIELDGDLGTNYCGPAIPNSTGLPGEISADGEVAISANNVTLNATQLPPGQFGYFLTGQTQGMNMPMNSLGFICLDGNIGRYNTVADIIQGPSGSLSIDLGSMPVNPSQAVMPGETWNFQCWYRDIGDTNNFTDGLSITFF